MKPANCERSWQEWPTSENSPAAGPQTPATNSPRTSTAPVRRRNRRPTRIGTRSVSEESGDSDAERSYLAGASNRGRTPSLARSGLDVQPLADASGYYEAGSVNGGPAKKPLDWRNSFLHKDLCLQTDELFSVPRSATLPNYVKLHIIRLM